MKQLCSEKRARLTELKRELIKSVANSRHFKVTTCTYDPPKRAIPARVKRLMKEIDELESEIANDTTAT